LVVAMVTADALDKVLRAFVLRAQRHAASATEFIFSRLKTMAHRNPLVEHKAITLPQAGILRNGFQILENSAFKVVDLVVSQRAHVSGGFFAANAAGAEHGHLPLAVQHTAFAALLLYPARKLSEAGGLWIDGAFECANLIFVVIARIHQHD